MPQQLRLCHVNDLEHDTPRCIRINHTDVFVVRRWAEIYALENRCGHAAAALHQGEFTDGLIVCPLHGAAFNVKDGSVEWTAILPPPMSDYIHSENPRIRFFGELMRDIETLPIRAFAVEVIEDEVYITLP